MKRSFSVIVALLFLAIATINIGFCYGSSYTGRCIESERQALLRFKQDLNDSSNRLASWTNGDGDCCTWVGVACDNFTGHVLELHLGNPLSAIISTFDLYVYDAKAEAFERSMLGGKINPSLLDLKQLIYLDLSLNHFGWIEIPTFLGSMRNLRYLNLSAAGFAGMIPHQLGNLSNLQYLDLGSNSVWNFGRFQLLSVENLGWLSGLSLLEHLDLSIVDLSKTYDWLSVINTLPSLVVLRLSACQLNQHPQLPIVNFSSLAVLDLSVNQFDNSLISSWIFGLRSLVFLDLRSNNLQGPILNEFQNLTTLKHLDLSSNDLNHSIPSDLWHKLKDLEYLSLRGNDFGGTVPDAIRNLTSLKVLDLSNNFKLEGKIARPWETLCNLNSISLSSVNLSQDISEILDIFSGCVSNRLELLDLENSQVFGKLTNQLEKFKNVKALSLRGNSIFGSIPSSLKELSSLEYLDLAYNKLNGYVFPIHLENLTRLSSFDVSENSLKMKIHPDWVPPFQLQILKMRSCHLGPQFPSWLFSQKDLVLLDMSNSGISDKIPSGFWKSLSRLGFLNLSHNQIYGQIPELTKAVQLTSLDLSSNNLAGPLPLISSNLYALLLSHNAFGGSISHFLCSRVNMSMRMIILNLQNNFLSGELPDCWINWNSLDILILNNNKFTGSLPTSLGYLSDVRSLHLYNNSFSGVLPTSLQSCAQLVILDISENKFVGNVPTWIGGFSKLIILIIRSNKFHGHLPEELCHLASLQILDLSHNNLSGTVPRCINNMSGIMSGNNDRRDSITLITFNGVGDLIDDASVVIKGKVMEYNTILNLVRIIDLSENSFSGQIPTEITYLTELQSLNLSHNFFTGGIPENIGAMRSLESIDFSVNQLQGKIPESMSSLTFLNHLNLSYNNLTGKIPSSTQLQSLDASAFIGNELCGSPLSNNCTAIVPTPDFENGGAKDGNAHEVDWFYASMALGFVVGFWSVIGPLVVNRRWRYKYCHFLDWFGYKFGSVSRNCF